MSIRALLLTLVVLVTAGFGWGPAVSSTSAPQLHVILYGDSLTNDSTSHQCDWCDEIESENWTIWNAARGGARLYDDDEADPFACETATYDGCNSYIEHQVVRHPDASGCQVGTANNNSGNGSGEPLYDNGSGAEVLTCLADLPVADTAVVVVWGGANGASRTDYASWVSTYEALWQAAYDRVVAAIAAEGNACVLVVTSPIWENQSSDPDETYLATNAVIEDQRTYINSTLAPVAGCEVVDLYQAVLDYETTHGERKMLDLYNTCPQKGLVDTGSRDCLHFGLDGYDWVGPQLKPAIRRAYEKKRGLR